MCPVAYNPRAVDSGAAFGGEGSLRTVHLLVLVGLSCLAPSAAGAQITVSDWRGVSVEAAAGAVDSGGVRIEYHTAGEGPLLIFLHGIASPWFDYRHQIVMLAEQYRVAVMSTRGTQGSGRPAGDANYATAHIAGDVSALIEHLGAERATIVGQDSGGLHAWHFAMTHPEQTERLIALGSVHPAGLIRELIDNPDQQKGSAFQWGMIENPDAGRDFAETLRNAPADPDEPANLAALRKAANESIYAESVVAFYKTNWPARPVTMDTVSFGFRYGEFPPVQAPTLLIYGKNSPFFLNATLNDMWQWVDAPLTIQVLPGVGHGPHREAPELVTRRMLEWLETGR